MDLTTWPKSGPVAQRSSHLPSHAATPRRQLHHILTSRRLSNRFTGPPTAAALLSSHNHHPPPSCISNNHPTPLATRAPATTSHLSSHLHLFRRAVRFSLPPCAAAPGHTTTTASATPTPSPSCPPPPDNDPTTPTPPSPTSAPTSSLLTSTCPSTEDDNLDLDAPSSSFATMSLDWNDWMDSSSSDGGEGIIIKAVGVTPNSTTATNLERNGTADDGGSGGGAPTDCSSTSGRGTWRTDDDDAGTATRNSTSAATAPSAGGPAITIRVALYAVASSFDRRQLEGRLKAVYGVAAVRKYPDVIHCQLSRGAGKQPGADLFFFDYGVVAAWGLSPEAERDVVRNVARECAVQPLPDRDQERDVFRCSYASNLADATHGVAASSTIPVVQPAAPATFLDGDSSAGGTTSTRRLTRRAERISGGVAVVAAAVGAPLTASASALSPPPLAAAPAAPAAAPVAPAAEPLPPPAGPYSVLSFPPQIADDTVLLHVRHIGDTATHLAVSYGLAQSTKLSAFEQAVEAIVEETRSLPEALAEKGEVHLSAPEIGRLIGKVFVLKRSVNLLGSVTGTPEFFWYVPDQLQTLYNRIAEYVELGPRVEQLNNRFSVLQEMLELIRAQEEARHGNRLEWIVIWLIVVEVVLGVFELLELFGVIGPGGGF